MKSDNSVKGLVSKKYIDPETGKGVVKYFWKRNLVPKVEITGKLPNKLSGLTLIQKDLNNALKWMQMAKGLIGDERKNPGYIFCKDRDIFDHVKALFVASLTFYGKCYTEANGRGAQVSRNWLDDEHKKIHDFYMGYRHNFAAHSGDEKVELAKTYVLLHPKRKEELLPYLPTIRLQPDIVLPDFGDKGLEDLIVYVSTLVSEKYDKLSRKIVNEMVLTREPSYWRSRSKIDKPVELQLPPKR